MIHKNIIPLIVFVFFNFQAISQVTTVLQPDADDGKDALIWSNDPNVNRGAVPSNIVYAWTNGGLLGIKRSLVQFDLSEISANAEILEAKLSLYYNPSGLYRLKLERVIFFNL